MRRTPAIFHSTSEPFQFFGRTVELAMLDEAMQGGSASVIALVGPGGQGKTAIVQHWLQQWVHNLSFDPLAEEDGTWQGLFFWSFYRGKDSDLCLRSWLAYAEGLSQPPEVSASYCVDRLLTWLRRERWAVVLDGTEVVQYDSGPWFGRFVHPELGRLLEELASEPLPGVVVLTSRFPMPTLAQRRHARLIGLSTLDEASAVALLKSLGVQGTAEGLCQAGRLCGWHAKAVELLGTFLVGFHNGQMAGLAQLPPLPQIEGASEEENHVARVLLAWQQVLPAEALDILALATNFRHPPTQDRLLEYLSSPAVHHLLHQTWGRGYLPFLEREVDWLAERVEELVRFRLLERVGWQKGVGDTVIDAHPLVRSGFDSALGPQGRRQSALSRGGFLRGRPQRQPPATLAAARDEVELFHAQCDAGLWNEADSTLVALDNPKHRFLAPAFERDLLLRFFPGGDWRQPPLWSGFGRYRSLAISLEMLGLFADALAAFREDDAPLRGDALIALGRLAPLLDQSQVKPPWQNLWQAYRAHALCLAGRTAESLALARSLISIDIYEWVHVFECLLRNGALAAVDLASVLYRPPQANEHRWSMLARQRMRADYLRLVGPGEVDLGNTYAELLDAYDRGGLPFERALTRLSYGRWLLSRGQVESAAQATQAGLVLGQRYGMPIVMADALELASAIALQKGEQTRQAAAWAEAHQVREQVCYWGPTRP